MYSPIEFFIDIVSAQYILFGTSPYKKDSVSLIPKKYEVSP